MLPLPRLMFSFVSLPFAVHFCAAKWTIWVEVPISYPLISFTFGAIGCIQDTIVISCCLYPLTMLYFHHVGGWCSPYWAFIFVAFIFCASADIFAVVLYVDVFFHGVSSFHTYSRPPSSIFWPHSLQWPMAYVIGCILPQVGQIISPHSIG